VGSAGFPVNNHFSCHDLDPSSGLTCQCVKKSSFKDPLIRYSLNTTISWNAHLKSYRSKKKGNQSFFRIVIRCFSGPPLDGIHPRFAKAVSSASETLAFLQHLVVFYPCLKKKGAFGMCNHLHRYLEGLYFLTPPGHRELIEMLKYFFQSIERFFKKGIFTGAGQKLRNINNINKFISL
jgi:hypothetical protein